MDEKRLLILSKIEIVYELLNKNFANALKKESIALTTEQFRLLDILADNQGISQSKLSELIGRERATISRALAVLESNGHIERKGIDGDKRSNAIHLTKKSKKLLNSAQSIYIELANKSLVSLSNKEVDKTDSSLDKLIEKLNA